MCIVFVYIIFGPGRIGNKRRKRGKKNIVMGLQNFETRNVTIMYTLGYLFENFVQQCSVFANHECILPFYLSVITQLCLASCNMTQLNYFVSA